MENKATESQGAEEPEQFPVKRWIIAGVALMFFLSIGGFYLKSAGEKNQKKEQEKISISENEKTRSIKRSEIMELFPEFRFREKFPVGDREYYLALSRDQLVMIQMLGSAESLEEITMTTFMDPKSTDKKDALAGYQKIMREKITPGLTDSDISKLTDNGDKVEADGFGIIYSHLDYGDGNYSDSYSFKKIK